MSALPKILPINTLKDTAKISKTCEESDVPIVITKNGYGKMVLMSVDLYEKTILELETAMHINNALDEVDAGAKPVEGHAFFKEMKDKYGSQS